MNVLNKLIILFVITICIQSCITKQSFEITKCSDDFVFLGKLHSRAYLQHTLILTVKSTGNSDIDLRMIGKEHRDMLDIVIKKGVEEELRLDWYSEDCFVYYKCPCPNEPEVNITVKT